MRANRPGVYLAAPLFNDRERAYNHLLAKELECAADVFLPQRDGGLLTDLVAAGIPLEIAERRVFEQDARAMATADILVALLDGGHIDEGVAFEVGYMRALGKLCLGLQSDVRRALPTGNNPMISAGLHRVFSSIDAVRREVEAFGQMHSVSEFDFDGDVRHHRTD